MPNRLSETPIEQTAFRRLVEEALREDIGEADCTTTLLVSASEQAGAKIVAKEQAVVAGLGVCARVFHQVDPDLKVEMAVAEGSETQPNETVMTIQGRAQAILTAERVALNFLSRCSGIATLTRRFVQKVSRWDTKILDTRKTTPGMRLLERYAVRVGGGENHRMGLYDQILVKDNHHDLLARSPKGTLIKKLTEYRKKRPDMQIEVEVDSIEQLEEVLAARPDIVLLDNMDPQTVEEAVGILGKRAQSEVSGGVTLDNVQEYARAGADRISVGALTHSAPGCNFSLDILSESQPQ